MRLSRRTARRESWICSGRAGSAVREFVFQKPLHRGSYGVGRFVAARHRAGTNNLRICAKFPDPDGGYRKLRSANPCDAIGEVADAETKNVRHSYVRDANTE